MRSKKDKAVYELKKSNKLKFHQVKQSKSDCDINSLELLGILPNQSFEYDLGEAGHGRRPSSLRAR